MGSLRSALQNRTLLFKNRAKGDFNAGLHLDLPRTQGSPGGYIRISGWSCWEAVSASFPDVVTVTLFHPLSDYVTGALLSHAFPGLINPSRMLLSSEGSRGFSGNLNYPQLPSVFSSLHHTLLLANTG